MTTEAWMQPVMGKLKILCGRSFNLSIFMVPNELRRVNEDAYNPNIVSIGPFHSSSSAFLLTQSSTNKDDQYLQAMEEHKWWYTLYLLHRTPNPKETLNACGTAIKALESRVNASYEGNIKLQHRDEPAKIMLIDGRELAEIMLIDGCFILELFIRSWCSCQEIKDGDFIFHNGGMVSTLQRDLALLENQIPFFILEDLYDIVKPQIAPEHIHPMPSINDLSLHFFHPDLKSNQESKSSQARKNCKHLLDLLHNFHTDPEANRDQCSISIEIDPEDQEALGFRKCATKLSEDGFMFEKGKKNHLLGIEFNHGVIKIQPLCIDEKTVSLLMNLIAFEQCSPGSNHLRVSSYVILLKSLIDSSEDVELLKQKEIITHNLVGDEDVLIFFNNISRNVKATNFYFGKLFEDVNAYKKSWWHWNRIKAFCMVRKVRILRCWKVHWKVYWKDLKRDYFPNPWSFISFIAALMLLVLTFVQTYYSVHPH